MLGTKTSASLFLRRVHLVVETRKFGLGAAQLVLYLPQALALGFRQEEHREEDADDAADAEDPKGRVGAPCELDVAVELGDDEGEAPADADCDTGSFRLHFRGEHLAHDGPGQRTPADAVDGNVDDEGNDRKPRDTGDVIVRDVLQVEEETESSLKFKITITSIFYTINIRD